MTENIAKTVFDNLLSVIRSNGFTDIGAFVKDQDIYNDTEDVIDYIEKLSQEPENKINALRKLINASIEYFRLASKIPNEYAKKLEMLKSNIVNKENLESEIVNKIIFQKTDEDPININEILQNPLVDELISFLEKIQKSIEDENEAFLELIN